MEKSYHLIESSWGVRDIWFYVTFEALKSITTLPVILFRKFILESMINVALVRPATSNEAYSHQSYMDNSEKSVSDQNQLRYTTI